MSNSIKVDSVEFFELKVSGIKEFRHKFSPCLHEHYEVAFRDAQNNADTLDIGNVANIDLSRIIADEFFFKAIVSALYNKRAIFVSLKYSCGEWMIASILLPKIIPISCPSDEQKAAPSGEFDAL